MTVISATASVGGSDVLRPRVWLGNTVHAVGRFVGLDRKPVTVGGVAFVWCDPDGTEVTTAGLPADGGLPGTWTAHLPVTVPGIWVVRLQCETPHRQLDWVKFTVVPGLGTGLGTSLPTPPAPSTLPLLNFSVPANSGLLLTI